MSYWLGLWAGVDILKTGDGNPGATNLLRATDIRWGAAAYCADFSKAAIPVGLAYYIFDMRGWEVLPIAIAPVIGHMWSVFLGGRGGKALAAVLGTWIGLTLYEVPAVMLIQLIFWAWYLSNDGLAVLLSAVGMGAYLYFFLPNPIFGTIFVIQLILVMWTHRHHFLPKSKTAMPPSPSSIPDTP